MAPNSTDPVRPARIEGKAREPCDLGFEMQAKAKMGGAPVCIICRRPVGFGRVHDHLCFGEQCGICLTLTVSHNEGMREVITGAARLARTGCIYESHSLAPGSDGLFMFPVEAMELAQGAIDRNPL